MTNRNSRMHRRECILPFPSYAINQAPFSTFFHNKISFKSVALYTTTIIIHIMNTFAYALNAVSFLFSYTIEYLVYFLIRNRSAENIYS